MVSFCNASIDFPRQIIPLSEWMEWPKTSNELTGIKNPTITTTTKGVFSKISVDLNDYVLRHCSIGYRVKLILVNENLCENCFYFTLKWFLLFIPLENLLPGGQLPRCKKFKFWNFLRANSVWNLGIFWGWPFHAFLAFHHLPNIIFVCTVVFSSSSSFFSLLWCKNCMATEIKFWILNLNLLNLRRHIKGGVNPIFFKHMECCNFHTITEMYIKYTFFKRKWVIKSIFDIKFY